MLAHSRVDPEGIRINWVTDTDMAGGALRKAFTGKHSESACHMLQLPLSLLVGIIEFGNTGHRVSTCSTCTEACGRGTRRLPRKHSKTFTGCWTCRTRRVKCDETRPICTQCTSKRLDCAGYGVRLHWLPPEQEISKPNRNPPDSIGTRPQRSQIPFEPHQPPLTEDQIDHILSVIDNIEPESNCHPPDKQKTFVVHSFGVFNASYSICGSPCSISNSVSPIDKDSSALSGQLGPAVLATPCETIVSPSSDISEGPSLPSYSREDGIEAQGLFRPSARLSQSLESIVEIGGSASQSRDTDPQPKDMLRVNSRHYQWEEPSGLMMYRPSPAYLSPLEQFLMHHYKHRVVRLFCVIDNMKSPWQKIHLTRALQSTGQMNVEGSISHIQDALRNALLSTSAFILSNDRRSHGCEDDATRWANEAMFLRGKTIKLLKDSVEGGFGCTSPPKYKDFLATMLSMISINVMSGETSTCGVHLDGAFHFIKMARNWKVNYSPKARSLHRIYVYLRTIYESTAIRSPQEVYGRDTSTQLIIPELSDSNCADLQSDGFYSSTSQGYPESGTRMSSYECIYGVPHYLLILLRRATELIVRVTDARERSGIIIIPDELTGECDELENTIMDWVPEQELQKVLVDDMSASSEIIRRTARAFHHALIIYFAQNIRLVGHRYLRLHIESVLDCIEAIEKIKADIDCLAAPLYWPAFIAASEAFDVPLQERFKAWYEQVEIYGIAAVRTGISVLTQVWEDGAGTGNRITSAWRVEVLRTNSHLMLS
ncbi:fungal-specific transcription factor domain-containing protein [Aspergillus bertholletiae]|uniref:Fungal-specific transcription factor domain-containing protein n=1 Tax=Aspergillus bertholletiae TaxID=1226010 RepID=A0A5N7BJD1_9EURO|nr:fungal-specific transcription factor domain-containing protein [Aspergillus bertholletiae]